MIQSASDTYVFRSRRSAHMRTVLFGWLWCVGFLFSAGVALFLSSKLLPTYPHTFTPYLRWQDALVTLLWFFAFVCTGGSVLVLRFLHAVREGHEKGMITLAKNSHLTVRDLSSENMMSIFWMIQSSFWCAVVVLIGLVPFMLVGWTLHLASPMLAFFATGAVLLVSIAGLVLSVTWFSFIIIGCFGAVSYYRKLGCLETYKLNSHMVMRIDNAVLTIIYPGTPETMIDLAFVDTEDRQFFLSLLHDYIIDTQDISKEGEFTYEHIHDSRNAVLV